jgi:hypothetical protein
VSDKAMKYQMPFPLAYVNESAFSEHVVFKLKQADEEPDLRLKLSLLQLDTQSLNAAKQHQPSYQLALYKHTSCRQTKCLAHIPLSLNLPNAVVMNKL